MGMSEREHHIKVLEQSLHDYQEWGEDLELEKTIKYAISSLKTDLKYDLMYEKEEIYTKADMVAMLKELKKDIIELPFPQREPEYMQGYSYCQMNVLDYVIQQKINALKGNE
jgi:hypothetical protein